MKQKRWLENTNVREGGYPYYIEKELVTVMPVALVVYYDVDSKEPTSSLWSKELVDSYILWDSLNTATEKQKRMMFKMVFYHRENDK